MLKIALLLVKNVFFSLNDGISELLRQVAQKHTVESHKVSSQYHEPFKNYKIFYMRGHDSPQPLGRDRINNRIFAEIPKVFQSFGHLTQY